jgi:hypothetical protein
MERLLNCLPPPADFLAATILARNNSRSNCGPLGGDVCRPFEEHREEKAAMSTESTSSRSPMGPWNLVIAGWAIALLLFVPSYADASAIIEGACDESNAWYDITGALHSSHIHCGFAVDGDGAINDPSADDDISWQAFSGTLVQLTNDLDASGHVIRSHYSYVGGVLELSLGLSNYDAGQFFYSEFTAQIITMDVFVTEGDFADSVDLYATFGPALLDAALANALGIGRHITGGRLADPFLIGFPNTDYTAMQRHAGEGAPTIVLDVPEPSIVTLCFVGIVALRARRTRDHHQGP